MKSGKIIATALLIIIISLSVLSLRNNTIYAEGETTITLTSTPSASPEATPTVAPTATISPTITPEIAVTPPLTITPTPLDPEQEKAQKEKEDKEKEKERIQAQASRYYITQGEPTATAIDNWLARCNSPQIKEAPAGKTIGQVYLEMGWKYGINPAYAAAFFMKESTCGNFGDNLAAHNFGNIRWSEGYPTLDKVWRSYSSWTEGMEEWFKLIKQYYVGTSLDQIILNYAPPSENDSELYMSQVMSWVDSMMDYAYTYGTLQSWYCDVTGFRVGNRFLAYWQNSGKETNLGYPISEQHFENGQIVQYFERGVLEYHPENTPEQRILLRNIGSTLITTEPTTISDKAPDYGAVYQPLTGHWLSGYFVKTWNEKGGLSRFGYPISEPTFVDGKLIQWFERARFEIDFMSGNSTVTLGLVGSEFKTYQQNSPLTQPH